PARASTTSPPRRSPSGENAAGTRKREKVAELGSLVGDPPGTEIRADTQCCLAETIPVQSIGGAVRGGHRRAPRWAARRPQRAIADAVARSRGSRAAPSALPVS